MALYTNTVTLKGYLGKDAETFANRDFEHFVVLSLATKSGHKDKQTNKWVNHTEWHRIVTFAQPIDFTRSLKKGDYVEVEGELRSNEYEKEIAQGKNKVKVTFRDKEILASVVKKLVPPTRQQANSITEDDAA